MISILKVIRVMSCGCLLGLSFATALRAAENPSTPENGLLAQRESDRIEPDRHTENGTETIKSEVVRIKQHFYLRQTDGKERHLHAKPTTEMKGELKKGDRIEVHIDDQNNALSIRRTK